MLWNKLKSSSPEQLLALRLTFTIVGVLAAVMLVVMFFGILSQGQQQDRFFQDRVRVMRGMPRFHETFESGTIEDVRSELTMHRKIPAFLRNIIVISHDDAFAVGFLVDNERIISKESPLYRTFTKKLGESSIAFYGVTMGDKKVFFYENMDMIEDIQIMLFFASFVLIFIFGGILYFIALKIAKKTIEPIKKSEEMARSYNHHIAHELKTPLSIIKSDLELAKRDPASLDSHIASAQEEVVLMRKTIDNLLFLAQKEAKKSVSNILLSDLLVETEREMQKLYEPKKLTFDFRGEKKTTILADDGLLKVLLNNLFDNAGKYASEKSVVVVDYSEKQLIFTNKTDSQIEPSALATVFEPFSGTPGSGHGLGLSIVKRICDIHDWKLSAKGIDNEFAISIEFK